MNKVDVVGIHKGLNKVDFVGMYERMDKTDILRLHSPTVVGDRKQELKT